MEYLAAQYRLEIRLDVKGCEIPPEERSRLQFDLDRLGQSVQQFAQSQLWLSVIYHENSQLYHAQAKLKLPGYTISTGAHDERLQTALHRCIERVIERVDAYRLDPDEEAVRDAERQAQLDARVIGPTEPDFGPLGEAVQNDDYQAFRHALLNHEEWVRKRMGRWVQRYPDLEAQIGDSVAIADLVEEVFFLAFERYHERSKHLTLRQWLESLLDPAVKTFVRSPEEERQAVRYVQTARQIPR